jgi:hypothetical protein
MSRRQPRRQHRYQPEYSPHPQHSHHLNHACQVTDIDSFQLLFLKHPSALIADPKHPTGRAHQRKVALCGSALGTAAYYGQFSSRY